MGEVIVDVAAILGGVTVIGAASWRWVVSPAFTKAVSDVVDAKLASAMEPIIKELSVNSGKSLKDAVTRIEARFEEHARWHERG